MNSEVKKEKNNKWDMEWIKEKKKKVQEKKKGKKVWELKIMGEC